MYLVQAIKSIYDSDNYTYIFKLIYSVKLFMIQYKQMVNSNLSLTSGQKNDTVVTLTTVTIV